MLGMHSAMAFKTDQETPQQKFHVPMPRLPGTYHQRSELRRNRGRALWKSIFKLTVGDDGQLVRGQSPSSLIRGARASIPTNTSGEHPENV